MRQAISGLVLGRTYPNWIAEVSRLTVRPQTLQRQTGTASGKYSAETAEAACQALTQSSVMRQLDILELVLPEGAGASLSSEM